MADAQPYGWIRYCGLISGSDRGPPRFWSLRAHNWFNLCRMEDGTDAGAVPGNGQWYFSTELAARRFAAKKSIQIANGRTTE